MERSNTFSIAFVGSNIVAWLPLLLAPSIVPYYLPRILCSQNAGLHVILTICKSQMGGRAFSYWASLLWTHLHQFQWGGRHLLYF